VREERDKAFTEWRRASAAVLKAFDDWDKATDEQGKDKARADFDKHFPVWAEAQAEFIRLDKLLGETA
jgi:hypothetical protein